GTPQGVSGENFMLDRKSLWLCVVRSLIVSTLAVSVWVSSTSSAHAETMIAADFEARVPLNLDDVSSGPAFGIRLGQQLHLPLLHLGVHMAYGRVSGDTEKGVEPLQWLAFGLHAALII